MILLDYRTKIIQSKHKTVRIAVTADVCRRESSSKLFLLATTHAKVTNGGNSDSEVR